MTGSPAVSGRTFCAIGRKLPGVMGMAAGIIKHFLMVTFGLSDLVLQIGCSAAQAGIIEFMNGLGSGHAC